MKNSQKMGTNTKVQQNYSYEEILKNDNIPEEAMDELLTILKMEEEQISVKDAISSLRSENFFEMHKSAIRLRKTLFVNFPQLFKKDFYQAELIAQEHELVPLLIHLIEYGSTTVIKIEAAWIISILTRGSTEVTRIIFQNGMVRLSLKALLWNKRDLTMRIIQILGNLAGESVIYRDSILRICGIQRIIDNIEPKYEATYIRCLANLCIGRPSPQFEVIEPAFKIFAKVIMSEGGNIKMINDAIWALGYMINGEQNRITTLINSGIVPQLINLLPLCNVVSILQIFERIFYGTEDQTRYLLECGFVAHIRVMLDPKSNVNTGEMIQTFAAKETLFKVLSNQNFLIQLFKSLSEDNPNLRGDALEVIAKAVQHGTNEDVSLMVKNRLILYILRMLEMAHEIEIASAQLKKGLEILIKLIRKGHVVKEKNQYFTEFVQMGGIGAIQKLLSYKQDDVAKYAFIFKQEFAL